MADTIAELLAASHSSRFQDVSGERSFAAVDVLAVAASLERDWGSRRRLAVMMPNGPELAVMVLAAMCRGAVVPLNPGLAQRELALTLADADVDGLLVDPGLATAASAARVAAEHGIACADPAAAIAHGAARHVASSSPAPSPDDVALLLHTSGTTASPKLVPLTHRNLLASAAAVSGCLRLQPDDVGLGLMPLFHIHGIVGSLLASLHAGTPLVVAPMDGLGIVGQIERSQATWMTAVPAMYTALLARRFTSPPGRLRVVRSSSAPLTSSAWTELTRRLEAEVVQSYGMTEAAHQMASTPCRGAAVVDDHLLGSVGFACGPEVAVLTAPGQRGPEAVGEGELVVRGPSITVGYLNPPEANADAFVEGWFRTGDLGTIGTDGVVRLVGRLKEMINVGGEKVSPVEIDDVLSGHPAVVEAAAFGVPSRLLGEEVAAMVRVSGEVSPRELQRFAREHLAKFKVPTAIVVVDEIPRNATGKVSRSMLRDLFEAGGNHD